MRRIVFEDTPHNLGRLHDELIGGVPDLAPIVLPDGRKEARFGLSGIGDRLELYVPDDLSPAAEALIAAVIAAHDPTPTPVPPAPDYGEDIPADFDQKVAETVANLRAFIALPSPTNAQTLAVVKLICRVVLWQIRRTVG